MPRKRPEGAPPPKPQGSAPVFALTKHGFHRCRIRCGRNADGSSKQHQIVIRTKLFEVYERRAVRLVELSQRLNPQIAGLDPDRAEAMTRQAMVILDNAAEQESDAAFDLVVARGMELCPGVERASEWETFGELAEAYYTRALYEKYKLSFLNKATLDDDEGRLKYLCSDAVRVPVYGTLAAVPLKDFSVEHALKAYAQLPATAKRWAAKNHYWQAMHIVLEYAVYPCRLIPAQPLSGEHRPKNDDAPVRYPYMHPHDDFLMLQYDGPAELRDVKLGSLLVRALFGVANREGCRISELLELMTWARINAALGEITIGPRKNKRTDTWDAQPGTIETLLALRNIMPELAALPGPFHGLPNDDQWAKRLVALLDACGARRELVEVFGAGDKRMRAHDTRATFVTLAKAYHMPETWITDRTGHKHSSQLATYDHRGWVRGGRSLGKLLRLDVALGRDRLGLPELTDDEIRATAGGRPPVDIDDPEAETNRETETRTIVRATVPPKWKTSMNDASAETRTRTGTPVKAADFESPAGAHEAAPGGVSARSLVAANATNEHPVSRAPAGVSHDSRPPAAPSGAPAPDADPIVAAFRAAARAALDAGDDAAVEAAMSQIAARRARLAPPPAPPEPAPVDRDYYDELPPVARLDEARRRRGGRAG